MKTDRDRRSSIILLLAGACFALFPEMALAILFSLKESSLWEWVISLCRAAGILAGLFLLLPAMALAYARSKQKNGGLFGRFLTGMCGAVLIYLLNDLLMEKGYPLLLKLFTPQYAVPTVIFGCLALIGLIVQGVSVCLWVIRCAPVAPERPVRRLLGHPLRLAGAIALTAAAGAVPDGCRLILERLPMTVRGNIPIRFLIDLLIAVIWAALFGLLLRLTSGIVRPEKTENTAVDENAEETAPGRTKGYPALLISVIGIAALLLIRGFSDYGQTPVQLIRDSIEEKLGLASVKLAGGDLEGGLKEMEAAAETRNLWASVIGLEQSESLSRLYSAKPSDPMTCYLFSLQSGRTDTLEKYLRVNEISPEISLALLDLYERSGQLTEQQEILKQELKYTCISTGTYTQTWLSPDDLESHREKLELALRDYGWIDGRLKLLRLAVSVLRDGEADRETVEQCLALAEENQSDWIAQMMAASAGSSLKYDGANHYGRTIEAAARYEQLYREAVSMTDEELAGLELKVGRMMIDCYGYERALPYLEQAAGLGRIEEAFPMAARCYEALERYEECYELCEKLLQQQPEHLSARYYAAISAVKTGKRDEAIEHASRLATLAKDGVTRSDYGADAALYAVLQFITVRDSGNWTQYHYAFYPDMTEDQRAEVEKNSFFADYLDAVYECFSSGAEDSGEKALLLIDRVLGENPNLPQAWYLKGTALYQMKRFEESAEAYRNSLEIAGNSATAWYALANAYDGMEEYRLAYEACEKTLSLLPEQDHGADWYGVSVHCRNLMDALEHRLEGR